MKRFSRLIAAVLITAAVSALLSGCIGDPPEVYYSVPQATERFIQLQEKIDEVTSGGATFAPPAAGLNRQSVQLQDLDGDGSNEAIAFFKVQGEKPLRIYVFSENGGVFEQRTVIEGEGNSIDSITYTDMNHDGCKEILVGWRMGPSVKMLTMYSVLDYQPVELASSDYSAYTVTDIDRDGDNEAFVINKSETNEGTVTLYNLMNDGEMVSSSAYLSKDTGTVARLMRGRLTDDSSAVFIDSTRNDGGLVTDVFTLDGDGTLKNITLRSRSGASDATMRSASVYCSDINDDGRMDVPFPRTLYQQTETVYYVIDWYDFSSSGRRSLAMTTYHNYSDGWYLVIPESWGDNVTVRREDSLQGERTIVFSRLRSSKDGKETQVEDFLRIHTLTGDNKRELAGLSGRFRLLTRADAIFAAEILTDHGIEISEQLIRDNFRIIYSDWSTGAI